MREADIEKEVAQIEERMKKEEERVNRDIETRFFGNVSSNIKEINRKIFMLRPRIYEKYALRAAVDEEKRDDFTQHLMNSLEEIYEQLQRKFHKTLDGVNERKMVLYCMQILNDEYITRLKLDNAGNIVDIEWVDEEISQAKVMCTPYNVIVDNGGNPNKTLFFDAINEVVRSKKLATDKGNSSRHTMSNVTDVVLQLMKNALIV